MAFVGLYILVRIVSQPQNQNKKGGVLRATLWAMGLGVFSGLVGYVVALRLSAILSYGSGGSFIVAHVLDAFNYTEASQAVRGIALIALPGQLTTMS